MHSLRQKLELARNLTLVLGVLSLGLLAIDGTQAEPLSTDNYRLDPNVADSFGGLTDSDQYELVSSGGDAVIGLGDSPSYKLSQGYVSQLEQSIELNVLPEGVVGHWPLNTGTGIQAYDVGADSRHGVIEGDPEWVDGVVGRQALRFDGDENYIDMSGSTDVSGSRSLEAWFRTTDDESTGVIMGQYRTNSTSDFFEVRVNDGELEAENDDVTISSGVDVADGEWRHVILSRNSSEGMELYLDGAEVVATDEPGGASGTHALFVGTRGEHWDTTNSRVGGRLYEGDIDNVKLYDDYLEPSQVSDQYRATASGATSALTLPELNPGDDESVAADAVVRTDAGGYNIAIDQDGDLRTEQGDTIAGVDGSIEFPASWQSDTTGFGFTVRDAVQRDGKWGSDPDFEYAAVPDSTTTFHTRDGLSGGDKEVTELEFRVGIDGTQAAGIYRNRLGFTATLKP